MSDLTLKEKRKLEKLFNMNDGYVLDFSNKTLQDFVDEYTNCNIYDEKYNNSSGSKANRLRAFWEIETNHLVGILIHGFIDYIYSNFDKIHYTNKSSEKEIGDAKVIANRLLQNSPVINMQAIKKMDSIDEKDLQQNIIEQIEQGKPELALDRIHTLLIKFLREKCKKYDVNNVSKTTALNALFAMFINAIDKNDLIESEMTKTILKTSISVLEKFNGVRNNQSYAHANSILNYDESIFIIRNIFSLVEFINTLEKKDNASKHDIVNFNDIPF